MSIPTGSKRRASEEDLQASSSTEKTTENKKSKPLSIGRHIEELKAGDSSVYFQVAAKIADGIFSSISSMGFVEKATLMAQHSSLVGDSADVYAHWKQSTIGDRPEEEPMPGWLNPKQALETKWKELQGTDKEVAKVVFLERVEFLIQGNETVVHDLCCVKAEIDIGTTRFEIEAEHSERSLKKGSSSEVDKKAVA